MKYHVGFCGVFDLPNYGDQLFPLIFKKEMEERGMELELDLFSICEGGQTLGLGSDVHTMAKMESRHKEQPFDAIVVGGGGIIHLLNVSHKLGNGDAESVEYPYFELWMVPALMAEKYRIPLLWNAPEVPYAFDPRVRDAIKAVCGKVDYLSVRDEVSRDFLVSCGMARDEVFLVPDSAFLTSKVFPYGQATEGNQRMLSFDEPYAVLHLTMYEMQHVGEEGIGQLVAGLRGLEEKGYRIVLLPLAYTHGDEKALAAIQERVGGKYVWIDRDLSFYDMMGILAGCEVYVGVSFHGALTALQYGKKAIAYDVKQRKKIRELFAEYQLEECYVTDMGRLGEAVQAAMDGEVNVDWTEAREKLRVHFDRMYEGVVNGAKACEEDGEWVAFTAKLLEAMNVASVAAQENERVAMAEERIKHLEDAIHYHQANEVYILDREKKVGENLEWYMNRVKQLEDAIAYHHGREKGYEEESLRLNNLNRDLNIKMLEMEQSFFWKMKKLLTR